MTRADAILQWVKGPNVLDVGCAGHAVEPGSTYWLHGRLRAAFAQVVGIDSSAEHTALLRTLGYPNIHLQDAETFNLPERFDTIVAGELIEHLANPGLFLIRAREHLAPAGRVVLTTPYPFSLLYTLYALVKFPRTCQNPQHTCWFCPRTLTELATRARLRVVHFDLIEDYRSENPSLAYRVFVRLIRWTRPLVPGRLRKNGMLFVLEASPG